jgi:hypothetical protein
MPCQPAEPEITTIIARSIPAAKRIIDQNWFWSFLGAAVAGSFEPLADVLPEPFFFVSAIFSSVVPLFA